jgi:hypothetical protein
MHVLYMISQLLLLALASLVIVICVTFVYKDKEDGETAEMTALDHNDSLGSLGESLSRGLKRKSARARSPVRRLVVTEHAEGAIPACTL